MISNKGQEALQKPFVLFHQKSHSCVGSSPGATAPHKNVVLVGFPQTRFPFIFTCSGVAFSTGPSVDISSIAVPHGHRDSRFHCSLHHRSAGEFALMSGPPASPHSSLLLVFVRLLLNTVFLIPLSSSAVWHFYAFYKILSWTSHHLGWVCWSPLEVFLVWSCPSFSSQRWVPHCQDLSNDTVKLNKVIFQWTRYCQERSPLEMTFFTVFLQSFSVEVKDWMGILIYLSMLKLNPAGTFCLSIKIVGKAEYRQRQYLSAPSLSRENLVIQVIRVLHMKSHIKQ